MQFVGEERQHKGQIMALKRVYKKFFKNSASTLLTILEVVQSFPKHVRCITIKKKDWRLFYKKNGKCAIFFEKDRQFQR